MLIRWSGVKASALYLNGIKGEAVKREFLFGLGSFFVVGAIGGLIHFFQSDRFAGAFGMLICMPLSAVTIRAAKTAPPALSRRRAVLGFLIGFSCIDAVVLGLFGIVFGIGLMLR